MARTARLYAAIDVNYFQDDRVLEAGDDWPLHLAAILACKRLLTDGELTRRQLARIAPDSVGDVTRAISNLVDVGLFIDKGNTIIVHAWSHWNDSSEDIEAMAKGGEYGNHLRWHVHRKIIKDGCPFCSPGDSGSDSPADSPADSGGESKSRSDVDVDKDRSDLDVKTDQPKAKPFELDFAELYGVWRKKTDRAEALRAYQARRRDGTPHDTVMRAARAYVESTKDKDVKLTKGLAVFLHGVDGPWSEYLEAEKRDNQVISCTACGRASNQRCPEEGKPSCPRSLETASRLEER